MNWWAILDPELWIIIGRMCWTLLGMFVALGSIVLLALAFWHGYSIEIGKPEGSFHIHLEQYPLKRFFQ